jgi:hypothetical protein
LATREIDRSPVLIDLPGLNESEQPFKYLDFYMPVYDVLHWHKCLRKN